MKQAPGVRGPRGERGSPSTVLTTRTMTLPDVSVSVPLELFNFESAGKNGLVSVNFEVVSEDTGILYLVCDKFSGTHLETVFEARFTLPRRSIYVTFSYANASETDLWCSVRVDETSATLKNIIVTHFFLPTTQVNFID